MISSRDSPTCVHEQAKFGSDGKAGARTAADCWCCGRHGRAICIHAAALLHSETTLVPTSNNLTHSSLVSECSLPRIFGRPEIADGTSDVIRQVQNIVIGGRAAAHQNFLPVSSTTPVAWSVTVAPAATAGPEPGVMVFFVVL